MSITTNLRPTGNGDLIEFIPLPANQANWRCVDDVTPDDETTLVYNYDNSGSSDYYTTGGGIPSGAINISVTIHARARIETASLVNAQCLIVECKYNGVASGGAALNVSNSWVEVHEDKPTDPQNNPWTTASVNAMQIGFSTFNAGLGLYVSVTQVYAAVTYDIGGIPDTANLALTTYAPTVTGGGRQGPRPAGSAVATSRGGSSVNWVNPGNVFSSDNTYATAAISAGASQTPSGFLDVTNFGFSIPSNSNIVDIKVEIERHEASFAQDSDDTIQLIVGGTATGSNKAAAGEWPSADAFATYDGDPVAYWGTSSLTDVDVNANNFGIRIAAKSAFNGTASIDFVRITVDYVLAPVLATPSVLALSLTTFAPQLQSVINAASPTALAITTFAPIVSTPILATPNVLALSLTTFVPNVHVGPSPSPSTLALTLTTFVPHLDTGVPLSTTALVLTTFAPVLNTGVYPSVLSLSLTTFAPVVTVSDTPNPINLILTTFAPQINLTINVPVATLTLRTFQLNTPGIMASIATSSTADSTKTPGGHGVLLALTTGDEVLIYQAGSVAPTGLVYRLSGDRGATWSAATQISSRQDVYPTAVVERDNNDVHLCYSMDESSPTLATTRSVYYVRMNYTGTSGSPSFILGSELNVMPGSATVAYERASMAIDSNYVPFVVAVRNTSAGSTIACAIGAVAGNLAGASLAISSVSGLNIFSPDVSLSATTLDGRWFVAVQSGGTCWLTRSIGPNTGQTSITFTALFSFGTDTVHTISAIGDPIAPTGGDSRHVVIGYLRNGNIYTVKWDDTLGILGSPVFIIGNGQRCIMSHDGVYSWIYFITRNGSVQLSAFATERFNWTPQGANSTASALWDWPQCPLRLDDAQISNFVWCETNQTPNNIWESRTEISIPKLTIDTGLGTEIINTRRPVPDTGTGLDRNFLRQNGNETSTGTDTQLRTFTPKPVDTGLGIELINRNSPIADAFHAIETLRNIKPVSESSTATDIASFKFKIVSSDTGSGAEVATTIHYINEVAKFSDVITRIGRVLTELKTGIDAAKINLLQAEAGTFTDVAKKTTEARDIGVGVELISRGIELLESLHGTDIIFRLNRTIAETGTGLDVGRIVWLVAESAVGTDVASKTVRDTSYLLRLLVTAPSLKLRVEGW